MNIASLLERRSIPFESSAKSGGPTNRLPRRVACQARTELLRTPDGFLLAVVPSAYEIDLESLEQLMGVRSIRRASRSEIEEAFPHEDARCLPPFGSSLGVRTVMDIHLASCEVVCFEHHGDAISMLFEDLANVESPVTGRIANPAEEDCSV